MVFIPLVKSGRLANIISRGQSLHLWTHAAHVPPPLAALGWMHSQWCISTGPASVYPAQSCRTPKCMGKTPLCRKQTQQYYQLCHHKTPIAPSRPEQKQNVTNNPLLIPECLTSSITQRDLLLSIVHITCIPRDWLQSPAHHMHSDTKHKETIALS